MSAPRTAPHRVIPLLVVVLGLAAAWFAWRFTSGVEDEGLRRDLENRGQRAAERLTSQVDDQVDVLRFVQSTYRHRPNASEAELQSLLRDTVAHDPRYATLEAVLWAVPVAPSGRAAFEASQRALHGSAYTIHGFDGSATASDTPLLIVQHVWDAGRERGLYGLDLRTDPALAAARTLAVASGEPRLAERIPLSSASAAANRAGLAVLLPVFRTLPLPRELARREELLRGVVVGLYRREALFRAGLAEPDRYGSSPLSITISVNNELLHEEGPRAVGQLTSARFLAEVCGSPLLLDVQPGAVRRMTLQEFLVRPSVLVPQAILLVLLLCAWIVWTILRQNRVIQQQVEQRTGELRRQNLLLERKERELNEANQRLIEMSNTDSLTGIPNRRAFEVQLDRERERSRRLGVPYGLLVFDIDWFKDFNDRYGHALGDEVLRRVAEIIQNEARRIDCVARYGGEEFVVLASGIDATGLMALGERIRSRVQEAGIENAASPHRVLTVSGGGALSGAAEAADPRLVFELADRCLYQAKSTGRNRVVMVM